MKILQIVYPGLGGSSAVAFSLVEGQKIKNKYKNYFLFYGIENLLRTHISKSRKLNIKHFFIKKKFFKFNQIYLFNYCNKISPDVIIVHDIYALPFYIYGKLSNKKIIFVHHTPDKTKKIYDWVKYFINGVLCNYLVLVSKRSKDDFIYKLNSIFFQKKTKTIVNGINTNKFSK